MSQVLCIGFAGLAAWNSLANRLNNLSNMGLFKHHIKTELFLQHINITVVSPSLCFLYMAL